MFIRYLTDTERNNYFDYYMRKKLNYDPALWLREYLIYELWEDDVYTVIKVFKPTASGKHLIYDGYHKDMYGYKQLYGALS